MSTENETIENQPELVHADSPMDGPGAALQKVREQLGLSIGDIATHLHLSSNVITALEADEYSKLAAITFARGYLRAYAKYLKLDDEDIIQRFEKLNITEPERAPIQRVVVKEVKAGDRPVKWISYTIALALGALVIVWWHNHSNSTQSQVTKQVATATLTTEPNDLTPQTSDNLQTINLQPAASGAPEVTTSNQQANTTSMQSPAKTQSAPAVQTQNTQTASTHTPDAPTTNKVHQSKKKFTGWQNPDLN